MRVLLDTNVLVSAILFGGRPRALLDSCLRGELDLVTAEALLDELEDVLIDRFGFDRAAGRLTRAELEAVADLAAPAHVEPISRDADDDLVLAAAVAGAAEVIVTGDKDLLVLGSHAGIPIRTPRQFDDHRGG